MNFRQLENKVIGWAYERNLFDNSTPERQFKKLGEEYKELGEGIEGNNWDIITDSIGDMVVVLILIAFMNNTSIEACLDGAYNEIKDRKGKIVNGIFVKE